MHNKDQWQPSIKQIKQHQSIQCKANLQEKPEQRNKKGKEARTNREKVDDLA